MPTPPPTPQNAKSPFTGGEAAVRGGEAAVRGYVAPTVQTTSVTNADNGVSWA